ncbi:MAG: efflux RND transporter periplasmic adaptor subunit [Bacteroidetes bacterium]|nr:efflux RND transporter periplasmic adaptor subunit [Bacteroidota bacterium]
MKKTIFIIAIVVIAAGVGAYFLFVKKADAKIEWRTAKVERGDLDIIVTATGSLSADTTVQVGTQVSGTISKIFVDFNSVVRKGQVIAIIDTTFLAAAVVDAQANLFSTSVRVDLTRRTFERTKELFEQKVMAQADYDQAYSDYQMAIASSKSSKASLDRSKINLKYATILAPVSGVVVSRAVDVGQTVAASFSTPTLFSIANDLTKMQVLASIDEADIGKIKNGQEVTFTVDAYENQTFTGRVSQIRLQPTVSQNVVNYTVIIGVPNPDLKLLPGMTANITVHVQEAKDILKVPASALRFNPSPEIIQNMMKIWPDSIKQRMARFMARGNKQGDQAATNKPSTAPGATSSGGQPGSVRQGGFSGNSGLSAQGGSDRSRLTGDQQHGTWTRKNMGFIWVKTGEMLIPQRVMLGLTDGSFTEVSGKIAEGDEIVTGIVNQQGTTTTQTQQSPFMPQMGRPTSGRGGR